MPETSTLSLPYPASAESADVPEDIRALAEAVDALVLVPVGAIVMWWTAMAPANWLLCDGAAIPAEFTDLIALVGSSTPNLQGRVPVGVGTASGGTAKALGATGGEETHVLTVPELPTHAHPNLFGLAGGTGQGTGSATADFNNGTAVLPVGNNAPHNNLPPFVVVNYIIRAG